MCFYLSISVYSILQIIAQALEGLSIESASDLQKVLRVDTYTTPASAFKRLEAMVPVFQSRMGALLFLISALLSRGLVGWFVCLNTSRLPFCLYLFRPSQFCLYLCINFL